VGFFYNSISLSFYLILFPYLFSTNLEHTPHDDDITCSDTYPVGKIAEKAVCGSVFLTTHSFRLRTGKIIKNSLNVRVYADFSRFALKTFEELHD